MRKENCQRMKRRKANTPETKKVRKTKNPTVSKRTKTGSKHKEVQINREHKSRLFIYIFGQEKNKEWTLSLYNAVSGKKHRNAEDIELTTIEDVVYMGMKNDFSLLISDEMNLYEEMDVYEHQSTPNPNMPLRQFMYAGKLYDKYIQMNGINIYSKKQIPLPVPNCTETCGILQRT